MNLINLNDEEGLSIPSMKEMHRILFFEENCIDYLFEKNVFTILHRCPNCRRRMKLESNKKLGVARRKK